MARDVHRDSLRFGFAFVAAALLWALCATALKLAPDHIDGILEKIAVLSDCATPPQEAAFCPRRCDYCIAMARAVCVTVVRASIRFPLTEYSEWSLLLRVTEIS